jgi:hypothetical protein
MATYERSYKHLERHAADYQAIDDIREYLTPEQWGIMMELVNDPTTGIQDINVALGFAGVRDYPFHAFCRKFKLAKYITWVSGDHPVDDEGFAVEREKEAAQ